MTVYNVWITRLWSATMRYGIAIWNFAEADVPLTALVEEFGELGFDAISFSSGQFDKVGLSEWEEVGGLLQDRDLAATIHCSFSTKYGDLETAMRALGDAVHAVTFDAAMRSDSRGHFYDWEQMGEFLSRLAEDTQATDILFGVEDFPLDIVALQHYDDAIPTEVSDCPRWGTLIDLGHLNLRCHREPYFKALTPQDYIDSVPVPILEVHVHDNDGTKDSHEPIGAGNGPFDAMAEGLLAVRFDGVSTIEIAPSFHGSTPTESKPKARESLDRWRKLMEENGL